MIIRKILEKDLDVIFQIGTSENNFQVGEDIPSFWPKDILQTWIKSNSDITLISEDKNVITGYILSSYHESNKKAVIENLWVHSKYRNKRVGSKLMKECVKLLIKKDARYICAFTKDESVLSFFEKNGFNRGHSVVWMIKST